MFCQKCGHELAQGAKFCDICGGALADSVQPGVELQAPEQTPTPAVRPPEIYADYPQTVPEPPKPKKKGIFLKILAVLLIAILFVSGVTVLGYFTFLPAKYTLLAAEYMSVQKAYKQLDSSLARQEKVMDAAYGNTVKSQSELSFSLDSGIFANSGLDAQTIDFIQKSLSNVTLKFGAEADLSKKKENLSLGVNYMNNPVLSINGFLDDKKLGLNIPELNKTSLIGEFKDIPRLAELYPESFTNSGMSMTSSGLNSLAGTDPWVSTRIHDEVKIEHQALKDVMQTYAMAFVNSLENSDMSIKRGQTTDVLGKETSCQEVTITLDQKAQRALLLSLLNTVKEDDNLYNLVFGNILKVDDIMSESNPTLANSFTSMGLDLDTVLSQTQIKQYITALKTMITADMFPSEMTIKAYIKGFDVVKYEVDIPVSDNGDNVVLTFESMINGDNVKKQVTLEVNAAGDTMAATINIDKQYDKASDTQDMIVELNADLGGSIAGNVNLKLDSNEDPDSGNTIRKNTNISLNYNIDSQFTGTSQGDLTIAVNGTETRNKDGLPTAVDSKTDVSINVPEVIPQPIKMAIAVKGTTTYGEKVETPAWATTDTIDLSTATREDLDAYMQQITDTLNALGGLMNFAP